MKFLIEVGANPFAIDKNGLTAYDHAALLNDHVIQDYLLRVTNELEKFKIVPLESTIAAPESTHVKILYKNNVYYIDLITLYKKYGHNDAFKKILKTCLFSLTQEEREALRKMHKTPLLPIEFEVDLNFMNMLNKQTFTDIIFE